MASSGRKCQAIIFDMDGLLVDSEPLWHESEKHWFAKVGFNLTDEDCLKTTGLRIDSVVQFWFNVRPWNESILSRDDVSKGIIKSMEEALRHRAIPMKGCLKAIEFAVRKSKSENFKLGIASSSPPCLIEAATTCLGIKQHFNVLSSAEKEPLGKPHPGVYLSCAKELGVDPTACVALEDSLNGVIAAKAARMKCVAVPGMIARHPGFAVADVTLKSLDEFDDSVWKALFGDKVEAHTHARTARL